MQGTEVLVVINTSTYYGEDFAEIDKLEKAIRDAIKPIKPGAVVFMITSKILLDKIGDCSIIAFHNDNTS